MGLLVLIPIAIAMGVVGFLVFLWTVRAGQYDDLDGAAHRILDQADKPLPEGREPRPRPPR